VENQVVGTAYTKLFQEGKLQFNMQLNNNVN